MCAYVRGRHRVTNISFFSLPPAGKWDEATVSEVFHRSGNSGRDTCVRCNNSFSLFSMTVPSLSPRNFDHEWSELGAGSDGTIVKCDAPPPHLGLTFHSTAVVMRRTASGSVKAGDGDAICCSPVLEKRTVAHLLINTPRNFSYVLKRHLRCLLSDPYLHTAVSLSSILIFSFHPHVIVQFAPYLEGFGLKCCVYTG